MTRNAGDVFDRENPLGGNAPPHGDRRAIDPEFSRDSRDQPPYGADEVHAMHDVTISVAERAGQPVGNGGALDLLSTADGDAVHTEIMDMATKIRMARNARGMSQRDLARAMGLASSAIAQWETNKTVPTLENRVDLVRVLGMSFVDLLPEADHLSPISVSNPGALLLLKQYELLPEAFRETLIMQAAALVDLLRNQGVLPKDNPGEKAARPRGSRKS